VDSFNPVSQFADLAVIAIFAEKLQSQFVEWQHLSIRVTPLAHTLYRAVAVPPFGHPVSGITAPPPCALDETADRA
jgi:hypothetical protein